MKSFHSRGLALGVFAVFGLFSAHAQLAPPPTEAQLQAAGAVRIQGDELAKLLKNQTLDHTNLQSGQSLRMYFREDGRRFIQLGSGVRDTKWWIQDGMRCEDSIAGSKTACQKIYRDGDIYRICSVGDPACYWMVTFTPGDVGKIAP